VGDPIGGGRGGSVDVRLRLVVGKPKGVRVLLRVALPLEVRVRVRKRFSARS
jgi:hypothetical protein